LVGPVRDDEVTQRQVKARPLPASTFHKTFEVRVHRADKGILLVHGQRLGKTLRVLMFSAKPPLVEQVKPSEREPLVAMSVNLNTSVRLAKLEKVERASDVPLGLD
jgi:hypothetical protein